MNLREDLNKIIKYLDTDHSYQNYYSLYNGIVGSMMYNYYLGKYLGENRFTNKANLLFNELNDALESGIMNFRIFHSFSYGITGVAYTNWHLAQYGFIETDPDAFDGIEEILMPVCEKNFNSGISDNLHGPMSVFYYLNKVHSRSEGARKAMDQLLEYYWRTAIVDERGLRIKNNQVKDVHETEYNMSLSHGLCGNLIILADAYEKGYRSGTMMKIIEEGLKYIQHVEKPALDSDDINSYYPSFFSEHNGFNMEENKQNYVVRLAWCYGDLNVALLFLRLGQVFDNKSFFEKGIRIAESTLWRKTRMQAQVGDVFFCHGASGLAYLYFKIYHITGKEVFNEQATHWMEMASERLHKSLAEGNEENPYSILEGYPGVALVYLSMLCNKPLPWDDIFLLNF